MGWGSGEDEEAGAILKVHEALGIFLFWEDGEIGGGRLVGKFCVCTLALSLLGRGDMIRK